MRTQKEIDEMIRNTLITISSTQYERRHLGFLEALLVVVGALNSNEKFKYQTVEQGIFHWRREETYRELLIRISLDYLLKKKDSE